MVGRETSETCCSVFRAHLFEAGERGLSIIVVDNGGTPLFQLQSRGIARRDIEALRAGPMLDAEVLINLSRRVGIQYCPWCGYRLSKLLRRARDFYRDLIQKHAIYEAM